MDDLQSGSFSLKNWENQIPELTNGNLLKYFESLPSFKKLTDNDIKTGDLLIRRQYGHCEPVWYGMVEFVGGNEIYVLNKRGIKKILISKNNKVFEIKKLILTYRSGKSTDVFTHQYEVPAEAIEDNVVEQNKNNSQDLGWGNYIDEINTLLLKATGQSNKTLLVNSDSFSAGVIAWKQKRRFNQLSINGIIDLETWGNMCVELGILPLVFSINDTYAKMGLSSLNLSFAAFKVACNGYRKLEKSGNLKNNKILSIADFTQSSGNKRLYILDLMKSQVLLQTNVAHGNKSGSQEWASKFSNDPRSKQSSLGFYVTLYTYQGHNGFSLKLKGMEKGFNDNAFDRHIVVHGAWYVKEGEISKRSYGCPAVDFKVRDFVINTIKDGTCFFIYFNDPVYLKRSLLVSDSTVASDTAFSEEYLDDEVSFEEGFDIDSAKGKNYLINVSAVKDKFYSTGVFIPTGFTPTDKVDIVLFLHGQYFDDNFKKSGIDYYWKNYSHIREYFYSSQRNAILIAPTLGEDPQNGKHCNSPSPNLLREDNGLDNFILSCLAELNSNNYLGTSAQPGKIILAAHSAGGCILSKILNGKNSLLDNVIECWGFDCLYGYSIDTWLHNPKSAGTIFYHYSSGVGKGKSESKPGKYADMLQDNYINFASIHPKIIVPHQDTIEKAWTDSKSYDFSVNSRSWFNPISSYQPQSSESYSFKFPAKGSSRFSYTPKDISIENDDAKEVDEYDLDYKALNSQLAEATPDEIKTAVKPDGLSNLEQLDKDLLIDLLSKGYDTGDAITSEIFYARHPERKGKFIDKTEKSAIKEYTLIKYDVKIALIRYVLYADAYTPLVIPLNNPKDWQEFKDTAVKIALEEKAKWNTRKEYDVEGFKLVFGYWFNAGLITKSNLKSLESGPYWSAAFISCVLRIAGAGRYFEYSDGHTTYIKAAKKRKPGNPFWLYKLEDMGIGDAFADENKIEPGDIICNARRDDRDPTASTFDSIQAYNHCNIITEIISGDKPYIIAIGGNVNDNVDTHKIEIDPATNQIRLPSSDKIKSDAAGNPFDYFAIIKVRATPDVASILKERNKPLTPLNKPADADLSESVDIEPHTVKRIEGYNDIIQKHSSIYGTDSNIVKGIIAAESDGKANTGQGGTGYKGLMQAETSEEQLNPETSIESGIKKFVFFKDKVLNPWLKTLGISLPLEMDENYLKICLACYNGGPVTALKTIQYANEAGDWLQWLSPENYQRALTFSGGYETYDSCNKSQTELEIKKAKAERLKYRFKTKNWRSEKDPALWSNLVQIINSITLCWIETKYKNTPGYLNKFIAYYNYFKTETTQ